VRPGFESLAPFFAPDVELHQAESLPYGGVWRGHAGRERFFVAMSQTWESFAMVEQTFLTTDNPAVVLTQVHARARATGRELAAAGLAPGGAGDVQRASCMSSLVQMSAPATESWASEVTRMLRIVRGEPSDEELAALTVALVALAGTAAPEPPARPSAWLDAALQLRRPLRPGAGAWRASGLPSHMG
jgi:hypothetical protein